MNQIGRHKITDKITIPEETNGGKEEIGENGEGDQQINFSHGIRAIEETKTRGTFAIKEAKDGLQAPAETRIQSRYQVAELVELEEGAQISKEGHTE